MENNTHKNIMFLVVAGVVLALLNGGILMAAGNGQLAPIDNLALWGAFVVLNICSLLWAVSLLGLQPMVVAVSYVAGGALAFMGVRMLPDINVAEVTTAGATYGAFGALAVGNATTRVRLAFFNKAQVPFIFVILALLLLDGLLNSQVSKAGFGVILNALVFPFIFSGAVVGLVWMLLVRSGIGKNMERAPVEEVAETQTEEVEEKPVRLVIEVPEGTEDGREASHEAAQARKAEEAKALAARKAEEANRIRAERKAEEARKLAARKAEEIRMLAERKAEEARKLAERKATEEAAAAAVAAKEEAGHFFPLEIDNGGEVVSPEVSNPVETDDVVPEKILEIEKERDAAKSAGGTDDWLNSHMDLLNELTKKAS